MPSTAIADIDYDLGREKLTVTFVTGRVYEYFNVPFDVAGAFERAESKGAFFNRHIRDRYRFREIVSDKIS
jgi:lysyl-tRNA synthetase class 2